MEWERIQIESSLVERDTYKAVLINMPRKSRYKGYSFWHPVKCCRSVGKNGYLLQISFTNEFKFRLKKMGKGKFNFNEVIDEKVIDSEELKEAFGYTGFDEYLYEEMLED